MLLSTYFLPAAGSALLIFLVHFSPWSTAQETTREKVEEVGQDTKKVTKRTVRNVQDKACEMVNGKLECAKEKIKNKSKNAADEIKDKAEDIKD